MQTVAVGTRWDAAGAPLPEIAPMPERGAMGAELWLHRDLYVDPEHDPLVVLVDERVGEARWLSAMTARYDRHLAETYLRGAGELACRANGSDAERRAWGARSMLAELACGLRLPETTLARRLARTTMLAAFPQLMDAAESGRVSSWHCDAMLDVFTGVTDGDVLARADAALIGKALGGTAPQLRAAARRWRARHVPRTDEQRTAALADRRVEVTPADDDLMWLSALIPAPAAVAIDRRLDAIAAAAGGPDDARSAIQLRADAFVDLLLDASTARPSEPLAGSAREAGMTSPAFPAGTPVAAGSARDLTGDSGPLAAPTGARPVDTGANGRPAASRDVDVPGETPSTGAAPRGTTDCRSDAEPVPGWVRAIRAEVLLTVPVLSLLGRSDEPAELEGFGPIDIETATLLAANAPSFVRVLTHPETGAVLSVGRDRYRIPADLRRTVQLRDVTCRFPGCNRRASRCDVDHSLAWADGGATEACNLACLCRKHHRLKHEMDWQVSREPGGVLVWRSALGRTYRTEPDGRWPRPPTNLPPSTTPPAGTSPPNRDGRRGRRRPSIPESVGPSTGCPDEPPF
ncbi:MAG: hypothetical protein BGO37_17270 [Cellulomonas sp. 73-92]|nr:MAG: hypothetical protein BGO37_17270 [Cellulomonas sp. 73-92]